MRRIPILLLFLSLSATPAFADDFLKFRCAHLARQAAHDYQVARHIRGCLEKASHIPPIWRGNNQEHQNYYWNGNEQEHLKYCLELGLDWASHAREFRLRVLEGCVNGVL
ncbi:MAG: hypothetical protein GC182_11255 [Rhodopseudomonas sp.]|nr:hypothetical protein [Rhodopseudomonas sp.]